MKIYKTAIIGLGRIGYSLQKDKKREQPASHSSAFSKNKNICITAGCDIDKKKIEAWKKDYPKARTYQDHKLLLKSENPDIVVIAVNEEHHYPVVKDVMDQKPKLIILEKPVAPDLESAKRIRDLSRIKKTPILINHERRFSDDYIELKKILSEKKLGKVHSVLADLWSNVPVWNKDSTKKGTGMLMHDATHLVDILFFLFDKNLNEPVIDKINLNKNKGVESLYLHSLMDEGIVVFFDISGNKKYFGFEIEVRGSHGRAVIGNGYMKIFLSEESPYYSGFFSLVKNKKYKRPKKTGYFYNMTKHCVDYLEKKTKLNSTIDDGVRVMEFLNKISKNIIN